ncbi:MULTISPECIES: hypothetical protein [Methylomonas]|uniref:Uncharacterized protein n=2 Tax=Methylomonas TaxID=416 RepID=A0A140E687_9GAMM|nr:MULTISPECIES: hypothetical protein [Methylomonas]AMK78911.1 hypothetical protein JT25_020895 [Methylomonas denitrificans]TCV70671.1 hypothetical protein EDE11_1701 [Methylomonas methanica]
MASQKSGKRTIRYLRANFNDGVAQNLQQLVATAYSRQAKIADRQQATDAAATSLRFISKCSEEEGFLCGHLALFERGSWQMVINDDPNATELVFDAAPPPTDKKTSKPQQWVQGALSFVIAKNHVAIVQSQALKASAFEGYLAWLLRDKTQLLHPQQGLTLIDEPLPATEDRIRKSHIKSFRFGRPLLDESLGESKAKSEKIPHIFTPKLNMVRIVKELMDAKQFEKLDLERRVLGSNLELWIELRHPARVRSKADESIRLLDDLACKTACKTFQGPGEKSVEKFPPQVVQ